MAHAVAREDRVPSANFGGLWGTGARDGYVVAGFRLIEYGGGLERQWFTDNIHRELLEAILDVPHIVALMPREIAGDANSAEAYVPRLGGAMLVEVDDRSPQIESALAARDD